MAFARVRAVSFGQDPLVLTARLDLPVGLHAPAQARAWLTETLAAWGRTESLEVAKLLTSELVTNAVRYGTAPLSLLVARPAATVLRVEVRDGRVAGPRVRDAGLDAEGGRGLHLVQALARTWGVDVHDDGKCVWFEITADQH